MEYSRDFVKAHGMFLERPDMFTFDDYGPNDLLLSLKDYNFFFQQDHITAFKPIEYGVSEVHTYTRDTVNPRHALEMLENDVKALSLMFHTLVTYVPDNFRGTINFLEKRLGFVNYGECAIRYYSGKPVKVNLLKRIL
ncbi:hypothetical protein PQC39_gp126 [Vibrio phage Vp_R1]|uniref:Uncharacterized protein n=1 Tax=Vibrio phage Vp_R1 TaxID=2059867 RepID=A0A2H5BQ77_9CAUD|nr:hypothetical protein PQC39_gp126 [Vibrio phage Vp_R1]AUG88490.1 hypothetical protein VPR_126 [Vibrio phage Vp_R1]